MTIARNLLFVAKFCEIYESPLLKIIYYVQNMGGGIGRNEIKLKCLICPWQLKN